MKNSIKHLLFIAYSTIAWAEDSKPLVLLPEISSISQTQDTSSYNQSQQKESSPPNLPIPMDNDNINAIELKKVILTRDNVSPLLPSHTTPNPDNVRVTDDSRPPSLTVETPADLENSLTTIKTQIKPSDQTTEEIPNPVNGSLGSNILNNTPSKLNTTQNLSPIIDLHTINKLKELEKINSNEFTINGEIQKKTSSLPALQRDQNTINSNKNLNFDGLLDVKELSTGNNTVKPDIKSDPPISNKSSMRNSTPLIDRLSEYYIVNPYDLWNDSLIFTTEEVQGLNEAFKSFLIGTVRSMYAKRTTPQTTPDQKQEEKRIDFKLHLKSILYLNKDTWSIWINNKRFSSSSSSLSDDNLGIKIKKVTPDFIHLVAVIKPNYLIPDIDQIKTGAQVSYDKETFEASITLYTNQAFSTKKMTVGEYHE
ncbi:hypothetical protein [Rickettsiales endosymbiont of Stachyamoeba lipophora]|uniref:hypothetical protein n=1 Tax=Rickettsiales endosymbiont of Stachyamoeba lipophora TaxID=2486578 RepID=UPI000F648192|nr:hypothetical protein [Rickettsiales endosymbiont of Stachyamoeba lipophora]AZL15295.1 hypothetical protein EF513_01825 [Rickettsiales endosymbiont of Stachyamoeba lipophora]